MPGNHVRSILQIFSTVLVRTGRHNPNGLAGDTLPEAVGGAVNPRRPRFNTRVRSGIVWMPVRPDDFRTTRMPHPSSNSGSNVLD